MTETTDPQAAVEDRVARYLFDRDWTCVIDVAAAREVIALVQPPAPSAPADRTALRDRIAVALYERERPPRDPAWADAYAMDREVFEPMADAVLAVLPAPVDRAAIARVRALHAPDENGGCLGCGSSFDPCPTIAVIDGPSGVADEAQQPECACDPAPYREQDGTYSHWAGCPVADAQRQADTAGEQQ